MEQERIVLVGSFTTFNGQPAQGMVILDAQNIALDSMAAIPVIDFSLLDPELTKSIEELKIEKFRIGSLGNLGTELYEEWDKQIGTLE